MKIFLGVFDLKEPEAVAHLVQNVGEAAAREIQKQAGDSLLVAFGRDDEDFSLHWTSDETAVLEALSAGMAEMDSRPPGGGLFDIRFKVGAALKQKMLALYSDHYRRNSGAPNVRLQ
jgi:hypothetical protein